MADVVIDMLAQGYTRAQIAEWQAKVAAGTPKRTRKKAEPQPEPEREQQPETDVAAEQQD